MHLTSRDLFHVLLPPVIVAFLFFGSTFGVFLPSYKDNLYAKKKEMIRELVHSAWSILDHYNTLEKQGKLTGAEARKKAREIIRNMRYGPGNKDYFWLNDMAPVMIMHPYRTDLEGRDVSDLEDPTGHLLFESFVDKVEKQGEGYVSYRWQWKDDPAHIMPKISFVKGFRPWSWIIGTGIYVDEVEAEIAKLSRSITLFFFFIFFAILIVSLFIVRQGLKTSEQHRKAEKELRRHRDRLEELVQKKTADLRQSNERLAQETAQLSKAQKQIEKDHNFLSSVIESLPFPFYVTDAENYQIIMANSVACDLSGGWGETCYALTHGRTSPCEGKKHTCPLQEVKRTGKPFKTEHIHFDKHGDKKIVEVHGYPIFDTNGQASQMIEFALDITKQKEMEEELRKTAITDPLTGLLNRRGFMLMADEQLKLSKRINNNIYLIFVDIDDMKLINDSLGHGAGDEAIVATSSILNTTLRESDVIGRMGGDEFAALIVDEKDPGSISTIITRLEANMAGVNAEKNHPFQLSLSYGILDISRENSTDINTLLTRADNLMYEQKRRKKEEQ